MEDNLEFKVIRNLVIFSAHVHNNVSLSENVKGIFIQQRKTEVLHLMHQSMISEVVPLTPSVQKICFTSLHLVAYPLPAGVRGFTDFHLSSSRVIVLTSFPFNSTFLQNILCSFFSQVSRGLPLGLFLCILVCQVILEYISSSILTMCPDHLNCANSTI
jgi:hypothetical protein